MHYVIVCFVLVDDVLCCRVCELGESLYLVLYRFFFFFKQKTAYEMRISDWSSDVCSSDLLLSSVGVSLDHGARNGVAGKPIAQSIVPIVMLGWEPFLDPSSVGAEVLPCPLQAYLRRLVPLTKHDDALHMGRYAAVSIAQIGRAHV